MGAWVGVIGARWKRLAAACGAFLCLAAAAAASHSAAAAAGGVSKVRFGGDQTETSVVVELDRATQARIVTDDPSALRLVVALPKVDASSEMEGRGQGLVKAWALDSAGGGARLRLELSRAAEVKRRFLLPPADGSTSYRYVIDLAATQGPAQGSGALETTRVSAPRAVITQAPALRRKKVIIIDAGHGGHDPGALGAKVHEKDVTLAAALALKARLEKGGRYRVVMTRDNDTFIPKENRVQIARRADADLFISLHADSGPETSTRGASVYTLSDQGSDRVAKKVIANNDWFINVDLPGRDRATNQILLDLTQRNTKNRSAAFAETLLAHVGSRVQLLRRSHRDAGFVVLLAPDVPAVLLEMGFITNPEDEARLTDPSRRRAFMDAVGDSIDSYFAEETQIAAR